MEELHTDSIDGGSEATILAGSRDRAARERVYSNIFVGNKRTREDQFELSIDLLQFFEYPGERLRSARGHEYEGDKECGVQ